MSSRNAQFNFLVSNSDKYDDFLQSNATIKKEFDRLTQRLNELANNAQKIEKALDDIEAYSYQYNLKVIGVPEITGGESAAWSCLLRWGPA